MILGEGTRAYVPKVSSLAVTMPTADDDTLLAPLPPLPMKSSDQADPSGVPSGKLGFLSSFGNWEMRVKLRSRRELTYRS